jgi:hypothetical protein
MEFQCYSSLIDVIFVKEALHTVQQMRRQIAQNRLECCDDDYVEIIDEHLAISNDRSSVNDQQYEYYVYIISLTNRCPNKSLLRLTRSYFIRLFRLQSMQSLRKKSLHVVILVLSQYVVDSIVMTCS